MYSQWDKSFLFSWRAVWPEFLQSINSSTATGHRTKGNGQLKKYLLWNTLLNNKIHVWKCQATFWATPRFVSHKRWWNMIWFVLVDFFFVCLFFVAGKSIFVITAGDQNPRLSVHLCAQRAHHTQRGLDSDRSISRQLSQFWYLSASKKILLGRKHGI